MRTFVLPFLGVGFILTVVEGDLPSVRITCSDHEHGVDPPLFVQTVLNEVHFRCASGFELVGQRISTCVSTGWDHELPSCRELPKTTLTSTMSARSPSLPKSHTTFNGEDDDNDAAPKPTEGPENTLPLILKRGPRPVSPKRPLSLSGQFERFFSSSREAVFEPVAKALQQRNKMVTPMKLVRDASKGNDTMDDDEDVADGNWLTEPQPNNHR